MIFLFLHEVVCSKWMIAVMFDVGRFNSLLFGCLEMNDFLIKPIYLIYT